MFDNGYWALVPDKNLVLRIASHYLQVAAGMQQVGLYANVCAVSLHIHL
jgi:hypothetical protein